MVAERDRGTPRKRRSPRYPVVGVRGTLHFNTEARIVNISLAGVALESSLPVRLGRSYSLTLHRDSEETLRLSGTVAWCQLREVRKNKLGESEPVYAAGLSFTDTLTEKAGSLVRFLERSAIVTVGQRVTGRFRLAGEQTVALNSDYEFVVMNISVHGLRLETEVAPQLGTLSAIEVFLPTYTLHTRARVAYTRETRLADKRMITEVGMEYVDLPDAERKRLADFIADELQVSTPAPT
jgi:hypothetical protein